METLLSEIEALPDERSRELAIETVQTLVELYGEALARMAAYIGLHPDGEREVAALANDELLSHLLLVHGLHPVDLETRVKQALDQVRPYLESHGGDVRLVGIEHGIARLRLQGTCNGCASSTATLKNAIEQAIQVTAPDLEGVEADEMEAYGEGPRPLLFCPDGLRKNTRPALS
jgi:Fe-S cluster biogenesis protein NfuA